MLTSHQFIAPLITSQIDRRWNLWVLGRPQLEHGIAHLACLGSAQSWKIHHEASMVWSHSFPSYQDVISSQRNECGRQLGCLNCYQITCQTWKYNIVCWLSRLWSETITLFVGTVKNMLCSRRFVTWLRREVVEAALSGESLQHHGHAALLPLVSISGFTSLSGYFYFKLFSWIQPHQYAPQRWRNTNLIIGVCLQQVLVVFQKKKNSLCYIVVSQITQNPSEPGVSLTGRSKGQVLPGPDSAPLRGAHCMEEDIVVRQFAQVYALPSGLERDLGGSKPGVHLSKIQRWRQLRSRNL